MKANKVDIIIPVYNVELYLRRCLDSMLAQTYPHWRAICVDDGSTDGSPAILDEYADKDSRFKVKTADCRMPVMRVWLLQMQNT